MPSIALATLNARYSHAALGLRYLRANLGALREDCAIAEFTLRTPVDSVVARLLALAPRVIGFGVYIWNVRQTEAVMRRLRQLAPGIVVVVGGPEVSHEVDEQPICRLADYVITGWGDLTFASLVRQVLHGPRPLMKVHAGVQPPLAELALPYDEYTDEDLRHRHLYVEASRGCPFKCEFCLSSLDRTAWPFAVEPFLQAMARLWQRGARRFKFVDRTFNLKVANAAAILEFFLARLRERPDDPPYLHFELIPDHLPQPLRLLVVQFPPGTLQFEIGIQTFNAGVQRLIARRQDNAKAEENLRWLRAHSQAHLHVDLIAGLPGEDVPSFAAGFDRLVALDPHEIQFGVLKRLRGAPIARHAGPFALRFNPDPPYNVLSTDRIDEATFQRLAWAARVWDLVANSGRFRSVRSLLFGGRAFADLLALSDWLHARLGRLHGVALEELAGALYEYLVRVRQQPAADVAGRLAHDYVATGARGRLDFVAGPHPAETSAPPRRSARPPRQARHLADLAPAQTADGGRAGAA